ncbi:MULTISPECIES: nuclear transport factor 2 family protein [Halobacterium]|uniref:DUF1486 family protein n=4 Tax=Halobacterium salinarum TaxID=2242 RepID=Q9HS78_HALSA|nr:MULTISPECIES: nuclear transport factor 2 family protein [Halobacterium]AAG18930.1 hypothetical protein VNG_0367H [Halobacterium salinarum NRC-1]MBB6089762.1 hypothetical protein [Halobacterium salinarum]MCF2164147.1 nuclear transport factor 2 family protein [Halobacterium salinarum]MCF2167777.1 nuclear transport factor 2 family protein [Halobacterium salinarum]MCF2206838.1 nuclear transport factor 2 family protein [Halobacterium salinarum]
MDRSDLVTAYYDAVDEGDISAVLALFSDDIVYERPGTPTIVGTDDLGQFYRTERALTGTHTVHTLTVDGDTVAVRGTFTGEQAGDPVEFGFADFHVIRDGAITERHTYTDRDTV